MRVRAATSLIVGLVISAGVATAVDYRWSSPTDGAWNVAANWQPQGVPISPADSAYVEASGAVFAIDLDVNAGIRGLLQANPTTTVWLNGHLLQTSGAFLNHGAIDAPTGMTSYLRADLVNAATGALGSHGGAVLQIAGDHWWNDGAIVVNLNEAAAAYLRVASHLTLSGEGRIVLQDSTFAILDSPAGYTLTNDADHGITGAGRVLLPLVNHGLVDADRDGEDLTLTGASKTNDGLFRASGGGRLRIAAIGMTNTGGLVLADQGVVRLNDMWLAGGDLASSDGGRIVTAGSVTLIDASHTGELQVTAGAVTSLAGSFFHNSGTVHVYAGGAGTAWLRMAGHVTADGGGSFVLEDASLAILDSPAGYILTNAPDHAITGTGVIAAPLVNHGLVSADVPGQDLVLSHASIANDGTLQAADMGRLQFVGCAVTNPGGTVFADGSSVRIQDSWIREGSLASSGSGAITAAGGVTLIDLAHSGELVVTGGSVTTLGGSSLINDGTVRVWDAGGTAYLRAGGHVTISGGGEIVLADATRAVLDSPAGYVLTAAATQTICGSGMLTAPLVNHGLVSADRAGQDLLLSGQNKANDGTLEATDGGRLRIGPIYITNTGGTVWARGGPVTLESATVLDGALASSEGAAVATSGTSTLSNIRNTASVEVGDGAILQLGGTSIVDDGVILVHAGGMNPSYARVVSHLTIAGAGTLELGHPTLATLDGPAGYVLTNGGGHAIAGAGAISVALINEGVVRADRSGGTLVLQYGAKTNEGSFVASGGGRLTLSVTPTNYNGATRRLTGGSWVAAGGVIQLTGCRIDTCAATVTLDGPGSSIDIDAVGTSALAGLVRNTPEGTLTVRNGPEPTTAAGFVNAGRMIVGCGSMVTASGTSYRQTPTGSYVCELAGHATGECGVLAVAGEAVLDGLLGVEAVDGFIPATDDTFVVMTFSSRLGDFANDGLLVAGGMYLRPVWRPHHLVLMVAGQVAVGDEEEPALPTRLSFKTCRTPDGPAWLELSLPAPASVDVVIFDLTGRLVAKVAHADEAAGVHEYRWNGVGGAGRAASGVYLARAQVRASGRTTSLVTRVVVVR